MRPADGCRSSLCSVTLCISLSAVAALTESLCLLFIAERSLRWPPSSPLTKSSACPPTMARSQPRLVARTMSTQAPPVVEVALSERKGVRSSSCSRLVILLAMYQSRTQQQTKCPFHRYSVPSSVRRGLTVSTQSSTRICRSPATCRGFCSLYTGQK